MHQIISVIPADISRVPDQNGVSQACYIVKIHHSGPEPAIWKPNFGDFQLIAKLLVCLGTFYHYNDSWVL